MRRPAAAGIAFLAVVVGAYSVHVSRAAPGYSMAGSSWRDTIALLLAGWALVGAGLAVWMRRPSSRCGLLFAGAGIAWFLPEWSSPAASASAFAVGLCFGAVAPALAGHAVLAYPGGRLRSPLERLAVAVAYAGSFLVLGVLPALVLDPAGHACADCPRNRLLVAEHDELFDRLNRIGVDLGLAWALALALLVLVKLARSSPAALRAGWYVLAAGVAYLGLVAGTFAVSLDRGLVAYGSLEHDLWLAQAASLTLLAAGAVCGLVRARRARSAVARLVIELTPAVSPGVQTALGSMVGDPELVLAYPLPGSDRLVDAHGRPVDLSRRPTRTTLVRGGRPVAVVAHAPGLLDDEQLVDEVTAAAGLALANEGLHAEVQARLDELRRSRARTVAAGDAERRRLERDLHDGAQQQLVALALSLRLVRSQVTAFCDPEISGKLGAAEQELDHAIAELRELAHGIFPAVLADAGLAVAVRALAEEGRALIRVGELPDGRFPAAVETAAYMLVAEAARAAATRVTVRGWTFAGRLVVEVEADRGEPVDVVALEDRIGALDGRLEMSSEDGRVTMRAELPCGS